MNKLLSLLLIIVIQQLHVNAQKTPYFQKFKLDNQLKVAFTQSDNQEPVIEIYENLKVENEAHLPGLKSVVFNCLMAIIQEDQEIASLIKARKCSTSVKDNKLYFRFPKRYTEHFLQIIAQTFKNPKFEDNTLQKVIQQQLSLLENDCQNPPKNAFYTQQIVNFKNYPYSKLPSPTSLKRIQLKNVITYYEQNFSAPTTRLIIIGPHPLPKVKKWTQQYFGDWKEKNFFKKYTKKSKAPKKRSIHYAKNKNESEAAILISHPIRLRPFGLYQHAASLLSFIYQQQLDDLFEDEKINTHFELKPDNNLGIFTAGLELPADQLKEVLPVFLSWIDTISQQKIQDSTFQSYKGEWIKQLTKYRNSIEGQLAYAHHFLLLNNAKPFYEDAVAIRNIQPSDITAAVNMFIHPKQSYLIIAAPASQQKSIQALFPDEDIHLHDCRGREIQGLTNSSKKITINTILEKYLDTIGGIKQLETIHSIAYTQTTHYAKSTIQKNFQKKAPNKLVVHQFFNQIPTKEIIYDGQKAGIFSKGKMNMLKGAPALDIEYRAYIFPELAALKGALHPVFIGMEDQFYVVEFPLTADVKRLNYYHMESGLKIKSILFKKGLSSTEQYDKYQAFQGILLPTKVTNIKNRWQKVKYTISNISLNIEIPDANFEFKN